MANIISGFGGDSSYGVYDFIGEPVVGHETTYFSKSGDEVYLTINMTPLFDSNDVITRTQGTAFDIT